MVFDIVFLDPPYKFKINNDYLNNMINKKITKNTTIFIIESDYNLDINDFANFNIKIVKYGKTYMNILKRKNDL